MNFKPYMPYRDAVGDRTVLGRAIPEMPAEYHDSVFDFYRDDDPRLGGWSLFDRVCHGKLPEPVWRACHRLDQALKSPFR